MNEPIRKKKPFNKKIFEIEVSPKAEKSLKYFMQQELQYYNSVVYHLNARMKAFPQDILAIRDRDVKLLETCAQFATDPAMLIKTKPEEWPNQFKSYTNVVYNTDGSPRIDNKTIGVIQIGSIPGNIHNVIRRNIVSEAFNYVSGQAGIVLAGQKTETLRAPIHMLQTHSLSTKRHMQLTKNLVKITFDEEKIGSNIYTPYSKEPLHVQGYDLSEVPFTILVIKSSMPKYSTEKLSWAIEFKDIKSGYLINLTDSFPRKKRR